MLSADASTGAPHQNLDDLVEVVKFLLFLFSLGSLLKDSVPIVLCFLHGLDPSGGPPGLRNSREGHPRLYHPHHPGAHLLADLSSPYLGMGLVRGGATV